MATMHDARQISEDEKFMRLALTEASKGLGLTYPNPAVGAVLVKGRRLLSSGYHHRAGAPHAEILCLRGLAKPSAARGATLYVTLEPCSTHGRTPPCTSAIAAAGIARVVYGTTDPNPLHAGRADAILLAAGVKVSHGILPRECAALNTAWNHWIATGLPYVVAKAGMSLDGRIAPPPGRRWITGTAARQDAMLLRATSQAILVGGQTVRTDNPRLTIRGLRVSAQPFRAVWTRAGNIPPSCHLLSDAHKDRTLIYAGKSLRNLLRDLGKRGVQQVLMEGGGRLLGEAFDRHLVHHVVFYIAPVLLGGPTPAVGGKGVASNSAAIRLVNVVHSTIGRDLKLEADVVPS